jgi:hypothetical protein
MVAISEPVGKMLDNRKGLAMTRGGSRLGAGRPLKPDAMVVRMYVIRRDQVAWLKSLARTGASMSQVVRTALDSYKEEIRSSSEINSGLR